MSGKPSTTEITELDDKAAIITLLLDCELSRAEALDYIAVEKWGHSQQSWADTLGVNRQTVNNNIRRATQKLSTPDFEDQEIERQEDE